MYLGKCVAVFAVLLLTGCATAYQSDSLTGGWRVKAVEGDVYRVYFGGNGFSSPETVQTYWLYRSAQLALDKGYTGFEVLSDLNFVIGSPRRRVEDARFGVQMVANVYVPMMMGGVAKPIIRGDIRLLRGTIQEAPPKVFDAQRLKDKLDPYVNGAKCGRGNICEHVHKYLFPEGKFDPPKA